MSYSAKEDLLIGDIILGAGIDPDKFVQDAADEMDSKLGWIYLTPIPVEGDAEADPVVLALPRHERLLLKGINNKLASGRLLLTIDSAGEQTTLHAWGLRLVKEATDELLMIANGDIDLSAPRNSDPGGTPGQNRLPSVLNVDDESLLSGFVNTVHGGNPWYVVPGGGVLG